MKQWYIKRGGMTERFHDKIGKCLSEFAKEIGQLAVEHINPACDLGGKIDKKDKVSFKVQVSNGGQSYGSGVDFRIFKNSILLTSNINGSKEIYFPIKIDIEVEPFCFSELENRKRQTVKNNLFKRIWSLKDNFKKSPVNNKKKKKALESILWKLDGDNFDDNIVDFLEQNISELEQSQ